MSFEADPGHLSVVIGSLHDIPPGALYGLIPLSLHRQLAVDVIRAEDGFHVQPRALADQPLLQNILPAEGNTMHKEFL